MFKCELSRGLKNRPFQVTLCLFFPNKSSGKTFLVSLICMNENDLVGSTRFHNLTYNEVVARQFSFVLMECI